MLDLIWVKLDHPRSAFVGLSLILKFGLGARSWRFCRFGLKLLIHIHFWRFCGIFRQNMVTRRSNPKKELARKHVV